MNYAAMDEDQLIEEAGWDTDSLIELYKRFIVARGLEDRFHTFLVNAAKEEAGLAEELEGEDEEMEDD